MKTTYEMKLKLEIFKFRRCFKIKIAIFPGNFEPITLSHLNILNRALKIFDKIIVLILKTSSKQPKISIKNRLDLIKISTKNLKNVEIDYWEKLLVDYAKLTGACAIVQGLRNTEEFLKKYDTFSICKLLNYELETVFLPIESKYIHITSELVLKMIAHKKNINSLVPQEISQKLIKILSEV